jgi:hypothetical protein
MFRALIAAVILASAPMYSMAADSGFYLGASVGQGGVDSENIDLGSVAEDFDGDDTGFKAIAGFRLTKLFAIEANYVDLGTASDTIQGVNVDVDTKGIDAFGMLFLPIPVVDLFLKAGVISWDLDADVSGIGSVSDDGTDLAYGVGAGFNFGNFGLRAEYERFEIEDTDTVDMISVGFTYTFL